eukprot:GHRR01017203.1.p1 GENE.GHRR01017203.1~~GHRR01017203.1.p1  ORF type:complete len:191 (+),score=32.43 GHRR01017203.1:127-699(+)
MQLDSAHHTLEGHSAMLDGLWQVQMAYVTLVYSSKLYVWGRTAPIARVMCYECHGIPCIYYLLPAMLIPSGNNPSIPTCLHTGGIRACINLQSWPLPSTLLGTAFLKYSVELSAVCTVLGHHRRRMAAVHTCITQGSNVVHRQPIDAKVLAHYSQFGHLLGSLILHCLESEALNDYCMLVIVGTKALIGH